MLTLQNLDDRSFEDILSSARDLIPKYSSEWTDENYHDPGITLLELFSWLIEMQQYYLNRITVKNRLKFLKLVGITPNPATVASVGVTFQNVTQRVHLPTGTKLSVGGQIFETEPASLLPTQLVRVIVQSDNGTIDVTNTNDSVGAMYMAFGNSPKQGSSLYLGFSHPLPIDVPFSLVFTLHNEPRGRAKKTESSTEHVPGASIAWSYYSEYDEESSSTGNWSSARIVEDETQSLMQSGGIKMKLPTPMERKRLSMTDSSEYYWIRCTLQGGTYEVPPQVLSVDLNTVTAHHRDTQSEVISFCGTGESQQVFHPHHHLIDHGMFEVQVQEQDGSWRIWPYEDGPQGKARCRFVPATGLHRSRLEFSETFGKVPPEGTDNIRLVVFTTAFAKKRDLGTSTGLPYQRFALHKSSVLLDSLMLQVGVTDSKSGELLWHDWQRVDDFDDSDPEDRHYVLDMDRGEILFGNDENGMVPEVVKGQAANIRVISLKTGGGTAGNVKANLHWSLVYKIPNYTGSIVNHMPALGGAAAETLEQAEYRAQQVNNNPTCAVTDDDLERLVQSTPGVHIDQAKVKIISTTPYQRQVVLQFFDENGQPTQASDGTLQTIRNYIEPYRLLTTQIEVVNATPVPISVNVTASVSATVPNAQQQILQALNQYFNPVPGSRSGKTWDFGDQVYRGDLYALISQLPGVVQIDNLSMSAAFGQDASGTPATATAETIQLKAHQFPCIGQNQVNVNVTSS